MLIRCQFSFFTCFFLPPLDVHMLEKQNQRALRCIFTFLLATPLLPLRDFHSSLLLMFSIHCRHIFCQLCRLLPSGFRFLLRPHMQHSRSQPPARLLRSMLLTPSERDGDFFLLFIDENNVFRLQEEVTSYRRTRHMLLQFDFH